MVIESLQNTAVKQLAKLKNKKERDASNTFLVEGAHMVQEAAQAGILLKVYQTENAPKLTDDALTVFCTQPVLNKLSSQQSDAKYIGVCKKPVFDKKDYKRILMLERIQDPGNLGTLVRSAYAFGAEAVFCSAGCADLFSSKVLQSTQGAAFQIPVFYTDLPGEIQQVKENGIPVIAAALHRDSIALTSLEKPASYALLIGNDGAGLSEDVLQASTVIVHIEMSSFESLNAAVAGSILLYSFQPDVS